jgi:hypothetical protein
MSYGQMSFWQLSLPKVYSHLWAWQVKNDENAERRLFRQASHNAS